MIKNIKIKDLTLLRRFLVSFPLLFMLFSSGLTSAIANPAKQFTSIEQSALVADISERKYYPAVMKAMQEAKDSIHMAMYLVSLRPFDETSQVYKLVNELIKAHKRGVSVKVILDQNIDFVGHRTINRWIAKGKNAKCFKMLQEAGVDVQYDDLITYTHAKAIVIDSEIVIIGSANWSESALNRNLEINVLIRSKKLASQVLECFKKAKIDERTESIQDSTGNVFVSWKFLENPGLAGRMLTKHDERAFDLYLLLLREFDGNPEAKIILNYDKMASYLGLSEKMTRTGYRRQIIRSLRKLEQLYNLIKFQPQFAKDATVTLLSYDDPERPYSAPKECFLRVPDNFWKYGWNRKLSIRTKFCYLINLARVSISNIAPWWFSSREVLTERFNVSKWVISKGMGELRSLNLIDVAYDAPKDGSYESLLAKSYKVLSLYDPEWLESEWDRLELAYGSKILKKARKSAKIVFEENDSQVVEDIIIMMNTLGNKPLKKAFAIVAQKRIDNPKRCYAYVKGILRQIEE